MRTKEREKRLAYGAASLHGSGTVDDGDELRRASQVVEAAGQGHGVIPRGAEPREEVIRTT